MPKERKATMTKPVSKRLYHVSAKYVSGQAVAAIHAENAIHDQKTFECITIEHEGQGPHRGCVSRIEWGENGHPLSNCRVTPEIWEQAAEKSDESERRDDLICIALSGAFAVRCLVVRPQRADRYPSCTDVEHLIKVEHYEPGMLDLLKRIHRRPYAKDAGDNLAALDRMLSEDALSVEPFINANRKKISGVAEALLYKLARDKTGRVQARLTYEEVQSAIRKNPSATEKVGRI